MQYILTFVKKNKLIVLVIAVAVILRFYKLNTLSPFIGDQAWFYISARDSVQSGLIPLVGITSSHTWLHQGPLWTYILMIILPIFHYNVLAGAYLTSIFGVITVVLVFLITKKMFSKEAAYYAASLYAVSPLIVIHSRFAYHTSLIPLFTLSLLAVLFIFIKRKKNVFPIIILLTSILYNFELATVILSIGAFFIILYFLIKNKNVRKQIFSLKTALLSFLALLPMLPIFVYDVTHSFPQTLKFAAWIIYSGIKFFIPHKTENTSQEMLNFLFTYTARFIFLENGWLAIGIIIAACFWFIKFTIRMFIQKKVQGEYFLLFLFTFFPLLALIITKTPSEAYLLMLFPGFAIILGLFFESLNKKIAIFIILIIGSINSYFLINKNFLLNNYSGYGPSYEKKVQAVDYMIRKSEGQEFSIKGMGDGSQFESFTMPYEYLVRNREGVLKKNAKIRYFIEEKNGIIIITQNSSQKYIK